MQAAAVELNNGTYIAPSKMTVGQWLDIWLSTYLNNVKPRTVAAYRSDVDLHIKPALGSIRIDSLSTHDIQSFYNRLYAGAASKKPLSAKTVKGVHGVLHHALKQAVANGLLHSNPADACTLPRIEKKELKPLDEAQITSFLRAIHGSRFELLYSVTLFTGMREGEVLGLTWDCVDFAKGTLTINKQMQLHQERGIEPYQLVAPKNSRTRIITAPETVMNCLKTMHSKQAEWQIAAGPAWKNPQKLVFTNELGQHLTKSIIYREFKRIVAQIGRPDIRFHDLRHSYAVAAIRSGDDIKTVQGNLGHATAAFTLDVYGHVTDQMKQDSAARMEAFIKSVTSQ